MKVVCSVEKRVAPTVAWKASLLAESWELPKTMQMVERMDMNLAG